MSTPKKNRRQITAQKLYGGIAVYITLFIFLLWWYFVTWPVLIVYICAVNVSTLLFYAWDKAISGSTYTRVPEIVLHGLALFGGIPMAIVGQQVFRHKTHKKSFRKWHYVLVIIYMALFIWYIYWV